MIDEFRVELALASIHLGVQPLHETDTKSAIVRITWIIRHDEVANQLLRREHYVHWTTVIELIALVIDVYKCRCASFPNWRDSSNTSTSFQALPWLL